MDTYYTIEEKYLQAVEEVNYGKTPKGLKLLNEIVSDDPLYARAHFQLGKLYFYELDDYQTAGYHFKTCMELEPSFPDNYFHYLNLVVFLNMEKLVISIANWALITPGVNTADIYDLLGLHYEKSKSWVNAVSAYQKAIFEVTEKDHKQEIEESICRVKLKMQRSNAFQYHLTG